MLKHFEGVCNGFFKRLHTVLINLGLILCAVRQTTGAADAAADTCHTFDEVLGQGTAACLEKRHAALLDAVADGGLDGEVDVLFLKSLYDCVRQTARTGKDAAVVGCIVQIAFFQLADVEVAAVNQRLKLVEGENAVNPRLGFFLLSLCLLGSARSDEDDLRLGVGLLDVLGDGDHRGRIVGNLVHHLGELLVDIAYESRAAGAGEEALFGKLACFCIGNDIGAQSCFDNVIEAEALESGDDLAKLCITELAGDGRCNNGINIECLGCFAFTQHLDSDQNEGFLGNCSEGALIYACAALDALVVINVCYVVFALRDSLNLAGAFAGTLAVGDGAVGACLRTLAALNALVGIDVGFLILVSLIRPPNRYRIMVLAICAVGFIAGCGFFYQLFDIYDLSPRASVLCVIFAFAEVGVLNIFNHVFAFVRRRIRA